MKSLSVLAGTLAASLAIAAPGPNNARFFKVGQKVGTMSGDVFGKAAPNLTEVSEYLGIPYAKPPVGQLRFAAPERLLAVGKINVTSFSPDCPANPYSIPLLKEGAQKGGFISEDCLTLNIWTKPQSGEYGKAVLLFIHGGGWQTGSTNDAQINGQYFAEYQDVVIVTINYRLNIFGFPGLPGMDQNLGLLDQRLAVEWVYENIARFGGDPNRITLLGQSAGSASVDLYSYAWTENPLVNGFIEQSGTVTSFFDPAPPNNTEAWYTTATKLNCGNASTPIPQTVACMRTKSVEAILNASIATGVSAFLGTFGPTVDNETVFADYERRAAAGQYIQKPYLIGNNDYEAGLFKIIAAGLSLTLSDRTWALFDLAFFSCPAEVGASSRTHATSTYRYRYFGEYPNTRLTSNPDSGAWHGAEIPVIWETTQDATFVPPTPVEEAVGRYLNSAWAAFAKDPEHALSTPPFSWPRYNDDNNLLIRLAYENETSASFIDPNTYDLPCQTVRGILKELPSYTDLLFVGEDVLAPLNEFANLTEMGGGSEVGY